MNKTLVVVAGPTGSGKTDLAIEFARHYGTEIISADSRQIFRGLPIGTAQPTPEQLAAVPHHFIATEEITTPYTCALYEQQALSLLHKLFTSHDTVIAAGGAGLYIDALCKGLDDIPQVDPSVREGLNARLAAEGLEPLLGELEELDPEYFAQVDRSNPQRVVRALEVCIGTGVPYSAFRQGRKEREVRDFDIIKIGIKLDRSELYDRIDRRVDAMMAAGLEAEARAVYPLRHLNALQTVGYKELFDCFDGKTTLGRAVELIKQNSRRYAKRQMTWFNRDPEIRWLDPRDVASINALLANG